jgi:hypothetical protein
MGKESGQPFYVKADGVGTWGIYICGPEWDVVVDSEIRDIEVALNLVEKLNQCFYYNVTRLEDGPK